ncbi:MAG: class I SAM-dependent methyltransferase [Elusimicrobiota bacterium]
MAIQCPICRDNSKTILMESRLNIYRCNSCLHTFTDIPKERQEKYDDDYFLKTHKAWFNNPNYELFKFIHKKLLKLLVKEDACLLDIGCGKGDFLKYILEKNSRAKLFGIDLVFNQHPGIHFIKGSFYDLKKEDFGTGINVICGLAVIEHVDDPHLFVQKLNSLLELGGLLFIMTVNNNSLIYRIARFLNRVGMHAAYDRLYSFHHLQHFTNQSLNTLLRMNGFEILLHKNHNYPMKAVDVPESNFLIEKVYKLFVWLIFLLSSVFGCGIYQTIICRKRNSSKN